jgi:MoaA/NifB/PqqE/SkfB family radical SAM enzyme
MVISLGGGEPMVHTRLPEIVTPLSPHNFLAMITNGWFMTPEKARDQFRAGMQQVCVSVDYADAQKHDTLRGKEGAYNRAIQALKWLRDNRRSPKQRVHMISVVMDDNLGEIEPLIRLSESLGVTYLVSLYSCCRGKKESRVSVDISEHLLKLKRKYPTFVAIPGYLEKFSEAAHSEQHGIKPCYAGKSLFNIDSQGNVGLCIDRLDETVGNILTEDVAGIQRKLLNMYEKNECGDCWTSCRGNIEPLLYGQHRLRDLRASYDIFQDRPLTAPGQPVPGELVGEREPACI